MIDVTRIGFDLMVPLPWLIGLGILAGLSWIAYIFLRGRAWFTRGLVLTLLSVALANPAIVRELREPLPSVAAIILDRSESMRFGNRQSAAELAYDQLRDTLGRDEALDLRVLETNPNSESTELFAALEGMMADVPRDRIAGAIFITDGQVHDAPDVPAEAAALGPVHALIVGDETAGDRRLEVVKAPTFGIVGESATYIVRVEDPAGGNVLLNYSVNGEVQRTLNVQVGVDTELEIETARRGDNVLVIEAPEGPQELTMANNRTALTISGVRDRLRVLLITGKPHAAGRVWRDLLKSDPQVDLVHFTILRTGYSQIVAPNSELALIPFPTGELFEEKLDEFDLIIFDQFERRGVVTWEYFNNIADYVDEGGALLVAAGENFTGGTSIARTPLAAVLPAVPSGDVVARPFLPTLSPEGERHTVTKSLAGRSWGQWLRFVGAEARAGDVIMSTDTGEPLMVVDRVGEGRVGMMLSDQIWLWARGYDGGGPFSELIRRLLHWLMKEPELEERQLALETRGGVARATLRTLSETPNTLEITTPNDQIVIQKWQEDGPGQYSSEFPVGELGLYRASAGELEAVALNGPANPREYSALETTTEVLTPVAEATGGGVKRINDRASNLPDIRRVSRRAQAAGSSWFGLRERDAFAVRDSKSTPLLPGILAALLAGLLMMLAWRHEGR